MNRFSSATMKPVLALLKMLQLLQKCVHGTTLRLFLMESLQLEECLFIPLNGMLRQWS